MHRQLCIAPALRLACGVIVCSAIILLSIQPLAASGRSDEDPKMSVEERAKLIRYLHESEKQLLDSIAVAERSAPGAWRFGPTARIFPFAITTV